MVTVLLLFLGSVRAALLTAVTIPLSLLFAFVCMHFSGIPANLLSLGALDFGIIVDGTLVMVEHVVQTLCQAQSTRPGYTVIDGIREAALEVESPIFFSLLIIISAYIPLFTLERVERRLFTPMAFTVCYALLGSMLLTLTLIPVLATYLFRNGAKLRENPVLAWLGTALRKHAPLLARACARDDSDPHRRGRRGVFPGRLSRHRIPAAAGRRHGLGARQFSGGHFARKIDGDGRQSSRRAEALPRSEDGQLANRPQRFRHRPLRTESQRVLRGARAVRQLEVRPAQGRAGGEVRSRRCATKSPARPSASRSRSSTTSPKPSPARPPISP